MIIANQPSFPRNQDKEFYEILFVRKTPLKIRFIKEIKYES